MGRHHPQADRVPVLVVLTRMLATAARTVPAVPGAEPEPPARPQVPDRRLRARFDGSPSIPCWRGTLPMTVPAADPARWTA